MTEDDLAKAATAYYEKFGYYPFGPAFDHLDDEELARQLLNAVATGEEMTVAIIDGLHY